MQSQKRILLILMVILLAMLACSDISANPNANNNSTDNDVSDNDVQNTPTTAPDTDNNTPVGASPDEPFRITGTIPFTSPFFINSIAEPFVMLEDQAGFYARDLEYVFPLEGQLIGPVWEIDDQTLGFSLSLPAVPQGTLLDVDNNGQEDTGVMVFQIAFWSNTWGGPFLEEREGTGWSGAYTSALVDPERDGEIIGGRLVIWAPDGEQLFPTGFGDDQMLFTEDDPVTAVPAGYSIVELDSEPFTIHKESEPEFTLVEGPGEVKDYSSMSRAEAFDTMFERIRVEYPFTADKNVDWDALYDVFAPDIKNASNALDYYTALKAFSLSIPDAHIGIGFNDSANELFYYTNGGGLGVVLAELSDGRVIVTRTYPLYPAAEAGIEVGAEIISWDGQPISEAIGEVVPFFGPYSTDHTLRLEQLVFLARGPVGTEIDITFQNPSGAEESATLEMVQDYESIFDAIPYFFEDPIALPVEAEILPSGIGYIKISTFSDDYNLMAQVYEYHIQQLIDQGIEGLIIDLRVNLGGSGGLASAFYGYFIEDEIEVSQHAYFNHDLDEFEYGDEPATLEPGPLTYDGPIVALVSPYCVSACEGFAYWLTLNDRATIVGHFGTAGAFGEVGRGQYTLPDEIDMQFPTGRPETLDGDLLIENVGVLPDVVVPVTVDSALGLEDTVLQAGVNELLGN
ncbi:MAG TPA: S41 family peptidase [Anaerolineales bacterium]|nr:S41 family peptidase [Anaerolineales bacterium]